MTAKKLVVGVFENQNVIDSVGFPVARIIYTNGTPTRIGEFGAKHRNIFLTMHLHRTFWVFDNPEPNLLDSKIIIPEKNTK